jgi:glycosyltransferase involved in cell wall biosynthesis
MTQSVPGSSGDFSSEPQPSIDVIIPTRGRPALLRETVRSIVDQDYAGSLRIVIVHDQEPLDETIIESSHDGRTIEVISNARMPGLAGARNTALEATDAEFVATCDDDDLWHPSKIRLQMIVCSRNHIFWS